MKMHHTYIFGNKYTISKIYSDIRHIFHELSAKVMLHCFFFNRGQKVDVNSTGMWRHLHFYQMAHIYQYWCQYKGNFKYFSLIWNMTGKKLQSFRQWQSMTGTRQIWRVNFMGGGSHFSQGGTTPQFKYFGNNFYTNCQKTCCNYFSENYLNFQRNVFAKCWSDWNTALQAKAILNLSIISNGG